jgi:hypothetical protein
MSFCRQLFAALALSAAPFLLPACRDTKIAEYTVPKEKDPEMPGPLSNGSGSMPVPGNASGGAAVPTAEGPQLSWVAPSGWQPKQLSAMRKGSYSVQGPGGVSVDVSITAFPGDVGGELANINRWRGQVGLAPLGDSDLPGAADRIEHNGLQFTVVDIASGQGSQRILGAIVGFGSGTWFFKLMGPDALVSQQKPAFLDFLKSVKPAPPE